MYSALNVNMIYLIYAWPNELEKREFAIRSLGNTKCFNHTFNKIRTTIYTSNKHKNPHSLIIGSKENKLDT